MQGAHGRFLEMTLWGCPKGPVAALSVEPNIATIGISRAEAMCIGPESFDMNESHSDIRAVSPLRLVFPAIIKMRRASFVFLALAISTISFAVSISDITK